MKRQGEEKNVSLHTPPRVQHGLLPETAPEVFLIPLAVRETRAGRLRSADAAAVQTPVHLWLMKAKHLRAKKKKKIHALTSQTLISVRVLTAVPPCSLTCAAHSRGDISTYIYTPFNINVKNHNLVFCHYRSALKKTSRQRDFGGASLRFDPNEGSRSTVRQRVRQIMSARRAHRMHASFWKTQNISTHVAPSSRLQRLSVMLLKQTRKHQDVFPD